MASSSSGRSPLRPYVVAPSPEDFLQPGELSPSSSRLPARYASVTEALMEDVDEAGPTTFAGMLSSWTSTGLLGFASTACVMPFEVGKTLMQVQWIPKADVELLNEYSDDEEEPQNVIYDVDELSDEDDAQAYFQDLTNAGPPRRAQTGDRRRSRRNQQAADNDTDTPNPAAPLMAPSLSVTRARDDTGYILRRSIFEQATKPEWILPFTVTGGVWDMMKAVGRWKGEGWLSLWKGQLTTFVIESLSSVFQPAFYSLLVSVFLRDSPFVQLPLQHIPAPLAPFIVSVASHMITALLLSPIDLVRTRLIVQSSQAKHKKYTSPVNALKTISEEEGGIATCYLHPTLAFPALLDGGVRSIFNLGVPLFIERTLQLSPDSSSVLFGLAEFALSTGALLVTLPIETVRRRLQVQSRATVTGAKSGKTYKTCVETRPGSYVGIVECVYRILTEETGQLHLHNLDQKPRRPSMSSRRASTASAGPSRSQSYRGAQARRAQEEAEAYHASLRADMQAQSEAQAILQEPPKLPLFAGISQLYRGFSMGVSANLIVLVLSLVAGRESADTGWTEM